MMKKVSMIRNKRKINFNKIKKIKLTNKKIYNLKNKKQNIKKF